MNSVYLFKWCLVWLQKKKEYDMYQEPDVLDEIAAIERTLRRIIETIDAEMRAKGLQTQPLQNVNNFLKQHLHND